VRAWQVTSYGRPSEALELLDVPEPVPTAGEILVRTTASVLNYNEVDGCRGRYLTINPPLPYTLGMECLGEVVDAGPGSEDWVGKRVTASGRGATGAHADLVVGSTAMAFEAPAQLSDVEAAAFFYPFHLAHLGLHERGRLAGGETVLVHAAAGGVGSAAVQLAVAAGARVMATVGDDSKRALVEELGAELVINYRSEDFVARVVFETDGAGVDVCFDGVGGDTLMQSLRCLSRGGRHLCVGFASGIEAEEIPMVSGRALCFGNFDLLGVILAYADEATMPHVGSFVPVPVPRFNPPTTEMGRRVQAHLLELLAAGSIRPIVGAVLPFEGLARALDDMESRKTVGRTVVTR
jgi:NADPH2:quinone reductase